MGVSQNKGVPYFGVLTIRSLLFGVLYLYEGPLFFGNPHINPDAKRGPEPDKLFFRGRHTTAELTSAPPQRALGYPELERQGFRD